MSDILFVDDEQLLLDVFERLFRRNGIEVTTCSSGSEAMELLQEESFRLVVTDYKMPEVDGLELLAYIRASAPETAVIMITAHANIQHAVRTLKHGAVDYIPKPFSTEELVKRVQTFLEEDQPVSPAPAAESSHPQTMEAEPRTDVDVDNEFIGEHPRIEQLKDMLGRISSNPAPVFIQGESGTGKEVLSRLIHDNSVRSDEPFIPINCANLPTELVESHLFGHRKGAFTGAVDDMTGAFEKADGGTLLLDEITEVDLAVQAKLLRVLQEGEIRRVGETDPVAVDVRVIATSNRSLEEALDEGVFREDLYHRLAVFPVTIPPLRERKSDIPLLVDHFIDKYCELYGLPEKEIDEALAERFEVHTWPGNVRQLENLVQRGVLLSADRTEIRLDDVMNDFFSDTLVDSDADPSDWPENLPVRTIDEMERHLILRALDETDNNQQKAASRLGISARTIRNKLKKYREQALI